MASEVFERVYEIVAKVPPGRVVTYGQIARRLGMPRGGRAVGWAMRRCPSFLPWHRVVSTQGTISARGHPLAASLQEALLADEGIVFDPSGHIDLEVVGWDGI